MLRFQPPLLLWQLLRSSLPLLLLLLLVLLWLWLQLSELTLGLKL